MPAHRPTMLPKTAARLLAAMADELRRKQAQDAETGKMLNTTRCKYLEALAFAEAMIKDYLYIGAPASHYAKGKQAALFSGSVPAPIGGEYDQLTGII